MLESRSTFPFLRFVVKDTDDDQHRGAEHARHNHQESGRRDVVHQLFAPTSVGTAWLSGIDGSAGVIVLCRRPILGALERVL